MSITWLQHRLPINISTLILVLWYFTRGPNYLSIIIVELGCSCFDARRARSGCRARLVAGRRWTQGGLLRARRDRCRTLDRLRLVAVSDTGHVQHHALARVRALTTDSGRGAIRNGRCRSTISLRRISRGRRVRCGRGVGQRLLLHGLGDNIGHCLWRRDSRRHCDTLQRGAAREINY